MNPNLAQQLVELGVIAEDTKVTAMVQSSGIGGTPVKILKEIQISDITGTIVTGYNYREPDITWKADFRSITEVGGMDIKRLASCYELNLDGTVKPPRAKPGRKSKKEKEFV